VAAELKGHHGWANGIAFSSDGNTLASASSDGTVRLWQAPTFEETDPLQVNAAGRDRAVVLRWRPVRWALAYNVYSVPPGGRRSRLVKLNTEPVTGADFTDQRPGLANGQPQSYAVVPFYRSAAGRTTEGPEVKVTGTPLPAPPGFEVCSVNDSLLPAWVSFDTRTGETVIRSASDFTGQAEDEFHYVCRSVAGNFQMTVRLPSRPGGGSWGKAGIMVRDGLDTGARHAFLGVTPAGGLALEWRPVATYNYSIAMDLVRDAVKAGQPGGVLLRLTRRGNTITPAYSRDGGRSFQTAGDPVTFAQPLPATVQVGLVNSSHALGAISEARFRDLRIEPVAH
jgi:hypothetical protein